MVTMDAEAVARETDDAGSLELKTTGVDVAGRTLEGWAAAWALDRGGDILEPTCADAFLARPKAVEDLPVYWCHDDRQVPIGTVLAIQPDTVGLRVKVRIFDHERGREVLAMAREMLALGRKAGFSIGYWAREVAWQKIGTRTCRVIKRLDLKEISLTPTGAQMNLAAVVDGLKTGRITTLAEAQARVAEWEQERQAREHQEREERVQRRAQGREALAAAEAKVDATHAYLQGLYRDEAAELRLAWARFAVEEPAMSTWDARHTRERLEARQAALDAARAAAVDPQTERRQAAAEAKVAEMRRRHAAEWAAMSPEEQERYALPSWRREP